MKRFTSDETATLTMGQFLNGAVESGGDTGAPVRFEVQTECGCVFTFHIQMVAADDFACTNTPPVPPEELN